MRIIIDGRMIEESGIGRYIRNLINSLQKLDQQNEYSILLLKKDFDKLTMKNNFKKVIADFRWYGLSEQLNLPKLLRDLKPDMVHFPHFNVPIFYEGKFIVTIHDLIHQHFQMRRVTLHDPLTYKIKQFGYKKIFKNAVSKSAKILVPSNYVRDLMIEEWGVDDKKITVTYEAVDDKILSIGSKMSQKEIKEIMGKFQIKESYLFYIGNTHPHKNVESLIKVFGQLRKKYRNLQLVLSGNDNYFWQRIKKEFNQRDIIYTGFITDEELVALYKSAKCLVMPSFEEGFGIPILEAMACSCPVVSSNAGALPEVGGNAAIYFDPYNKEDMVKMISRVLDDKDLRDELIKAGQVRIKIFSWEKLAKQTLEEYLK